MIWLHLIFNYIYLTFMRDTKKYFVHLTFNHLTSIGLCNIGR